jgi:hypothetical protein
MILTGVLRAFFGNPNNFLGKNLGFSAAQAHRTAAWRR